MTKGTRRGRGVSVTPWPLFTPGKDLVPFVQEAGWAPGPVWTGAENLVFTGIRSPDRPVRSQSLYRVSYRAHQYEKRFIQMLYLELDTHFMFNTSSFQKSCHFQDNVAKYFKAGQATDDQMTI